jgi:dolichyl-diphosphooligosaccharide--protein glycosyltransferase
MIRFYDGDCYLHIRKVLLHLKSFPHFITHDYFDGYPAGTPAITPPLLDWFIAALAMFAGLGKPTVKTVESMAAVLAPIAGGATVLALYAFGKDSIGKGTGMLAAAILAITPAHITYTVVGRPDNEMLEPLMALLMFWGYLRVQNAAGRGAGTAREVVLTTFTAMLALMLWRGATLWIGMLALGVICDICISFIHGEKANKYYSAGSQIFLLLGGMLLIFCSFNPWGNQHSFTIGVISFFHVVLFIATAIGLYALGNISDYWLRKGLPRKWLPVAIIAPLIAFTGTAAMVSPAIRSNMQVALGVLGVTENDIWLRSIVEYQPLLDSGLRLETSFGWALALTPIILVLLGRDTIKKNFDRSQSFVLVLTVCVLGLTLLRSRFAHILALFTSLLVAWAAVRIYSLLKSKQPKAALASAFVFMLLVYYPMASVLYALPRTQPGFNIEGYIEDAMLWVRRNTPSPGGIYMPGYKPPYGVLARWDFAGWIEYVAERPSVATLYGSESFGLRESAEFFTATDAGEAEAILRKTGTRYMIIVNIVGDMPMYTKLADRTGDPDFAILSPDSNGKMSYKPTLQYFNLVSTSLQYADGMPLEINGRRFKQLDHYRLLYESEESLNLIGFPTEVKKLKIFEYVKGAKLSVAASPGQEVTVSGMVRTNRGRVFRFLRSSTSDQYGVAVFTLPYGTVSEQETSGLVEQYRIESGGRKALLEITGRDVMEGTEHSIRMGTASQ